MKRSIALLLVVCMICTFAACGPADEKKNIGSDGDIGRDVDVPGSGVGMVIGDSENQQDPADDKYFTVSRMAGLLFAGDDAARDGAFEDVAPMYNVPYGQEFKVKLNLKEDFYWHELSEYIKIFMDRECTKEVSLELDYDPGTNCVTLFPKHESIGLNSYPREGIETAYLETGEYPDISTWGGLKTYYLVVYIDTSAETVKLLDKPKRMMFTIAADIDSPTVKAKVNDDGNVTLYWDEIGGADHYKIYKGNCWRMAELGRTDKTEFVLNDDREYGMNTLLSNETEYAVVAVKGENESRLSNLINGDDFTKIAPRWISSDEDTAYFADEVSIMELPRNIDVEMADYSTIRKYPLIWDLRNPVKSEYGWYVFYGRIPGTILKIAYNCYEEELPTEEEIETFYREVQPPPSVAENNTDKISIPNSPSIEDVPMETTEEIVIDIAEETRQENDLSLAQAIALGMLNHETTIDLSAYPEAGDPEYLRDVIQMVLSQCVLILDEEGITFDFKNQQLNVQYRLSMEESFAKQVQVLEKADEVIKAVIRDGMSVEEREKALHDWIVDNGQYHHEVLQAYYDGVDLNKIADQYADSFSVYGILVDGLGVCQSYAETFKLLCDLAEVPAVVVNGTLGSVPHAWNKVMIENHWYNVDVTNNDGEILPYPVYNSSDHMLKRYYSEDMTYVLDNEYSAYSSSDISQDYYYKAGLYSQTAEDLTRLIGDQLSSSNELFIKTDPDLTEEEIMGSIVQAIEGSEYQQDDIMMLYNLNILGIKIR